MSDSNPHTDTVRAWQINTAEDPANHYVLCKSCANSYIGSDDFHPIHESVVGRVLVCHGCQRDLSRNARTPPNCQAPDCSRDARPPSFTYCGPHEREYTV